MTNADKIKWFDDTIDWMDQWGSAEGAIDACDSTVDPALDLFMDFVEQYRKVKD